MWPRPCSPGLGQKQSLPDAQRAQRGRMLRVRPVHTPLSSDREGSNHSNNSHTRMPHGAEVTPRMVP